MKKRHWTKKEELNLLQGIGANSIKWLCRKSGNRSISSLYHKLSRIGYNGGFTRGSYTLRQLIELTGYSESQLRRAAKALLQKWRRTSTKGSFVITEDQMDELCTWLGKDFWSKRHKLYRCMWCNTQKNNHYGLGLCLDCYNEYHRLLYMLGLRKYNFEHLRYCIVSLYFPLQDIDIATGFLDKGRAIPKELLLKCIGLKQLREHHGIEACFKRHAIAFNEG